MIYIYNIVYGLYCPKYESQFGHLWLTTLHECKQQGIRQHPKKHLKNI